jgi:hypothetical protein
MGLTSSTPVNNHRSAPPTEADVRSAINNLFSSHRGNPMSDGSIGTINFNQVEEVKPTSTQTVASNTNGRPAKYPKYYVDFDKVIQNGGIVTEGVDSEQYGKISEFSEFERIKQHLLKNMGKDNQFGGSSGFGNDADLTKLFEEAVSETTEPQLMKLKNLKNFLYVLKGGENDEKDEDDLDDDEDKEDVDSSSSSSSSEDDDGEDDEITEDAGFNNYSENSQNKSSDINILPFYSTSSSSDYSFKHPYIKNRFN